MRAFYFIILFFISTASYSQLSTDPVKEVVTLYPNPAITTLWINISNKKIKDSDITVYNVIGNKLQLEVETVSEGKFAIDVNNLPAGYYLLVVENNEQQFTRTIKFMKK